jgi:hypothetical protein
MAGGHRLEAQRARHDTREWVVKRRERTRHLIELGGLVQKSGLVELADDDRALLYGAFLDLAFMLQDENREQTMALWRRRGSRAFKSEKEALRPPLSIGNRQCAHEASLFFVIGARRTVSTLASGRALN